MILAIGILGTVLYFGAPTCWHGVKKGAHEIGCMVVHGRKCLKK
jgi:hypothetical protein